MARQRIRIRLKAYDHRLLDQSALQIVETAQIDPADTAQQAILGASTHFNPVDLVGSAPPKVRRRCVAALTVFDGEEVEQALRAAAADRNPMVREAAEMVVGRNLN